MWFQFLLENLHFAINIFASLIFFATFWLYFDAWLGRKTLRDGIKCAGLFLLSVAFLIQATFIESTLLEVSFLGSVVYDFLLVLIKLMGYLLVLISLVLEPLQEKPQTQGLTGTAAGFLTTFGIKSQALALMFAFPLLSGGIGLMYLRRATIGLENHLKPVALSFFVLSLAELAALGLLLRSTSNVDLYKLFSPFGPIWIINHLLILVSMLILRRWVFGYLLKRFSSQIFIIFTTSIMVIYLLITVCFTALLLKNLQDEALIQIRTDGQVLNLIIEAQKQVNQSDATLLSQNSQIINLVETKSRSELAPLVQEFLVAKNKSTLLILDADGAILARGEDKDNIGDSLSSDPLFKRALLGTAVSSLTSVEGPISSIVSVKSVSPIKKDDKVIGIVLSGVYLDGAFLDGLKKVSGLESSILGGDQISATTLLAPDQKTRLVGLRESNQEIKTQVLGAGEPFSGRVSILNTPYLSIFMPLKDIDNTPIGMTFIGRLETKVLATASYSIELTFVIAALLLVLSILPAYLISRSLEKQIR